ncbi:hypothetical protein [Actinoplanes sp. HUAS TT8]|uniref:hypothetical protein n=1 Tax=Actinoplanes sp. HUAS TT8 TaxID=3447453 RepID=UPI003F526533
MRPTLSSHYGGKWRFVLAVAVAASMVSAGCADADREAAPSDPPERLLTDGVPGCLRGSERPVVTTTTPDLTAVFPGATEATFELRALNASDDPVKGVTPVAADGVAMFDVQDPGLAPGESYRWRATGAAWVETGWSQWCEFTVAADLTDLSAATDIDAVRELGVDPGRRYTVTLTAAEKRSLLEIFPEAEAFAAENPTSWSGGSEDESRERLRRITADVRAQAGLSIVLTGDDWASTTSEIAGAASARDETHAEEPEGTPDGTEYWKLLDRISAGLGGPAHPNLHYGR